MPEVAGFTEDRSRCGSEKRSPRCVSTVQQPAPIAYIAYAQGCIQRSRIQRNCPVSIHRSVKQILPAGLPIGALFPIGTFSHAGTTFVVLSFPATDENFEAESTASAQYCD